MLKNNKKGFSLLEVIFAISMIAIGVLAVCGVFLTSYKMNFSAYNLNFAYQVAQKKMDELLSDNNFISESAMVESVYFQLQPGQKTAIARPGWSLSYIGKEDPKFYQTITVTVSWVEKNASGNFSRKVQLVSAITK